MVMLRNDVTKKDPVSDLEEFPWFHLFLEEFNSVRNESKVWEAFLEWSGLSDQDAFDAVSYGTFPYVNVKKSIFDSAHDYGHFNSNFPDHIWVRRDSVQTYEKTTDPSVEYRTGKYLEMLILHELVHWGRHRSALGDDFEEGGLDSGKLFAKAAYNDPYNPHLG
jgi:hypothetical protein